jgi:hypothetical protein
MCSGIPTGPAQTCFIDKIMYSAVYGSTPLIKNKNYPIGLDVKNGTGKVKPETLNVKGETCF